MSDITLKELRLKSEELESILVTLISRKLKEFEVDTGLSVYDLTVDISRITKLGGKVTHVVSGVSVDIDYRIDPG